MEIRKKYLFFMVANYQLIILGLVFGNKKLLTRDFYQNYDNDTR